MTRDNSIYDDGQIPDAFIRYIQKYHDLDEEGHRAMLARYPYFENPWNNILEMANNYPDQQHVTFSYEWMEFCDEDLAHTLEVNPDLFFDGAADAIRTLDLPVEVDLDDVRVQITGYPHHTQIRHIRARHSQQFVSIEGTVRSKGQNETTYSEIAWQCARCEHIHYVPQDSDGKEVNPGVCENETCNNGKTFVKIEDLSTKRDFLMIEIQESPTGLNGKHPESIIVHCYDNLVTDYKVGDHVLVTGVVKNARRSSRQGKSNRYISIIEANHISMDHDLSYEDLEPEEIDEIMELSENPSLDDMFVQSLAPGIYGYANIKKALALQMFGGHGFFLPDGTWIRGDIHILLAGDPGVAKSVMMDRVAHISPRSAQASGKGASGVGLTATARPDSMNEGAYVLEAGVLPMADGGVAIVDEFDKISDDDKSHLNGAMEQQRVQVDKATIHTSMNTRCAVLAGANPIEGRFNNTDPLYEQVGLKADMLSRFDLIYIMRDIPNKVNDASISRQMLRARMVGAKMATGVDVTAEEAEQVVPPVSDEMFTKYIAYARANIHPVLTEEANEVIDGFILGLRGASDVTEKVHVTWRYLFGLCRLAEASARMHLRKEVSVDDAYTAINIMSDALQVIVDKETGMPNADIVEIGGTSSQRKKIATIKSLFNSNPNMSLAEMSEKSGIPHGELMEYINKLEAKGELMRSGPDEVISL